MKNPAAQGRPDSNHKLICTRYQELFCSVFDTHGMGLGFPDIIVGIAGQTFLVEIKSEDGKLRASQELFIRTWRGGKVEIVRTERDVEDHVQRVRSRFSKEPS